MWRRAGLLLGVVACAALCVLPNPLRDIPGAGDRPARAAGVALLMALWWLTDALPIGVTACVPLVAFPLLGVFGGGFVNGMAGAAAPYVDAYIFLFLGGMVLGAAMEETGLHRRVALQIMTAVGTDPPRLLLGMLLATAMVSLWISNTATAVMMCPIALALVRQLEAQAGGGRLQAYGGSIMLAVAYGANVGGIGTKIGTGTNSIFCGYASRVLHRDIGFFEYVAAALPFVLLLLPVCWLFLWLSGRRDAPRSGTGRDTLRAALTALGPMGRGERQVALVFSVAAVAWMLGDVLKDVIAPHVPAPWPGFRFQGKHYEATVAMLAGATVLALGRVSWPTLKRVPWDTLLLLGGSFAMAAGLETSGFSTWLAGQLRGLQDQPVAVQYGVVALSTVALSAVASNTATINVMLNVLPPSLPLLFSATVAASCDFALPAGTPPNAIVFGSGYVRLPVMMRTGALLDVVAALLVAVYAATWVSWIL
ncbi:MAG: DASS family sodium-coupled anion symporter [Deltaproteobacteria bacterium]|nr:DASS family sodium-coupled anion symporter [Deltaproteobacteria bacterium]